MKTTSGERGRGMTPQARYDKTNTKMFCLKLNLKTDADIIQRLKDKGVQTYIKCLIRKDMGRD